MKIMIVAGMYPPIITGTSFYAQNLTRALSEAGHEVSIVTVKRVNGAYQLPDEHEQGQLLVLAGISIPLQRFFKHYAFCSFFPGNIAKLMRFMERKKPDAVIIINQYFDIAILATLCATALKIPLYCSIGTQILNKNPVIHNIFKFFDKLICYGMILRFCRKTFAWDSEIKRYLIETHGQKFADRVPIIPYSVNGDFDKLASLEHDYSYKGIMLGVGSVIEQRNYFPAIKAFAKIADKFLDLKFIIIGHVYYQPTMELVNNLGLNDRVVFMQEQPHDVVLEYMSKCDVTWTQLTGKYGALGTANIEAMLCGVPVIVNADAGLIGDPLLIDGETAFLVPGKTEAELAQMLEQILTNKNLRENVGRQGKKFVMSTMTWPNVVKRIEEELLAS